MSIKIVRFLGGLGNQMFQYAFYKALDKEQTTVLADLSLFKNYPLHNGYELDRIFGIQVKHASRFYIELLKPNQKKWFYKRLKRVLNLKGSYKEESADLGFEHSFLTEKKHRYYWGYWQNENYFKNIKATIVQAFQFPPMNTAQNIALLDEIISRQSVSLHIRRGDYLKEKQLSNLCDIEYYRKAISYIEENTQSPYFYIFSDDISWCKANIKTENIKYVNGNTDQHSYIDMQLMSNCKHNIIANSSFSWWGAWLNQNPEKIVIAPSKWMNNTDQTLALEEWIKI